MVQQLPSFQPAVAAAEGRAVVAAALKASGGPTMLSGIGPIYASYVQQLCEGYVQLCVGLLAASLPFLDF